MRFSWKKKSTFSKLGSVVSSFILIKIDRRAKKLLPLAFKLGWLGLELISPIWTPPSLPPHMSCKTKFTSATCPFTVTISNDETIYLIFLVLQIYDMGHKFIIFSRKLGRYYYMGCRPFKIVKIINHVEIYSKLM